jgi:sigma-E factor negative regulatory protein RseA
MNERLRQSLSAVVDGEADAFELRRVLDELERDPELRAAWMRYHLIGSVIRGEHLALRGTTADRLGKPLAVVGESVGSTRTQTTDAAADLVATRVSGRRSRAALLTAATAFVALSVLGSGLLLTGSETSDQSASVGYAPSQSRMSQPQILVSQPPPPIPAAELSAAEPSAPELVNQQWVQVYMLQHAQQQGLDQRGVISLVRPASYSVP